MTIIERPRPQHRLSLLSSSTPPSISLPLSRTSWLKPLRHVHLRNNLVLLFRKPARAALTTTPSLLVCLQPCTKLSRTRSCRRSVQIDDDHVLTFHTAAYATTFLCAARATQSLFPTATTHPLRMTLSSGLYLAESSRGRVAIRTIPKAHAFFSVADLVRVMEHRTVLHAASVSKSPFLPRLLAAFQTPHSLNFVLPVDALGTLDTLLRRLPTHVLPTSVAKHVFVELVLALGDLHALAYLHRDLNPTSIHLTANGHVCLSDLSLAKSFISDSTSTDSEDDDTSSVLSHSHTTTSHDDCATSPRVADDDPIADDGLTRARSFVGSRLYMSPERLGAGHGLSDKSYGRPADMWSLGVILAIMLHGSHPFQTGCVDTSVLLHRVATHDIPVQDVTTDPALATVLRGLLCRDETRRWDLHDVKKSQWMADVDWSAVRRRAARNVDVPHMLGVLSAAGIARVDDFANPVASDDIVAGLAYGDCADAGAVVAPKEVRRMLMGGDDMYLAGFDCGSYGSYSGC